MLSCGAKALFFFCLFFKIRIYSGALRLEFNSFRDRSHTSTHLYLISTFPTQMNENTMKPFQPPNKNIYSVYFNMHVLKSGTL